MYPDNRMAIYTNSGVQEISPQSLLAGKRIFFLTGEINAETAKETAAKILEAARRSPEDVTLLIQSPGGSIEDGMIICDIMRLAPIDVQTVALGTVASMGAVIFASGTKGKRFMLPSSRLMIHEPLFTRNTPTSTSDAIRLGEMMTDVKHRMSKILSSATGQSVERIEEDTKQDKYFTAEEAVEYGLADTVLDQETFTRSLCK